MYTIQELTDESSHDFSLVHYDDETLHSQTSFDYAVPAETGDRDNRVVLYSHEYGSVSDIRLNSIDEPESKIREILLVDPSDEFFEEP